MLPTRLNGFEVVAAIRLPDAEGMRNPRHVVLVDRGERGHGGYVTAIHCEDDADWVHGDYLHPATTRAGALDAWIERCQASGCFQGWIR